MHFRKKLVSKLVFKYRKYLRKFENNTKPDSQDIEDDDYAYILGLPYFGKPSRKFAPQLSTLPKQRFNVRIFTYYTSLKIGSYFNLKIKTPAALKTKWFNLHVHVM